MKKMFRKEVNRLRAMAALTFAATLLSAGAQAATYYVTPTGAGAGDGTSWGSATANLQQAIDSCAANGGGEVWVKAGTYKPSATLQWKDSVNVYGGFAGAETDKSQRSTDATLTVLDGNGERLIAQKTPPNSAIFKRQTTWSGLTLQNGYSTYTGGIYLFPNMTIDNVIIKNCVATHATGSYGGGISFAVSAETSDTAIVRNCRIVGNTAAYGGGISLGLANANPIQSHVLIENTEIINNKSSNRGGGIDIEPKEGSTKEVTIRSCVIANNSSGNSGGGISLFRANAKIINTTFARNISGDWGGGGLYANSVDSLTVLNCIFWNNEDAQHGTGSHTILSQGSARYLVVKNSAFAPALQVGTDVPSDTSTTIAVTLSGNIGVNADNTGSASGEKYINFSAPSAAAGYAANDADKLNARWTLAQGSAAIDAGEAVQGLATDIVGRSRPVGSKFDMGAYEYAEPITIAAGATVSAGYTAAHGDVIFEASDAAGAGQWTATTPVTNGAVKLVRTFETNKTYAIGFPFAVASVSGADYELKYYNDENNLFGLASAVEAGKGYLIKFPAPKDTSVTVTFTSARNPAPVTPPALSGSKYDIVPNPTLQNAAGVAGAQHYYLLNSATGAFGAPATSLTGELKPFEAVLATAATADLLTPDTIGKGNASAPSVTLTADSGISVLTPDSIAYPYLTIDPFVVTFKVAAGYTNVRAIVSATGAAPDTILLTPVADIYTVTLGSAAGSSLIRLTADTIRSTLTLNAGEGIAELNPTGSIQVGYFDNSLWFTLKTLDGYHTPRVAIGATYKEVKKGVGGVDTVFLGGVTANATVNIAAFRNNTAPVLYDLQVTQAEVVNATGTTVQILSQFANYNYVYLKFDVKDAIQGSTYDKITLRLQMSANGTVQAAKKLILQWVSNNSNGGNENTDGTTPWDNNFTYAGRPVIKDAVSIISVGTTPGVLTATAIEFTIDDPAVIAQIKNSIAAGNTELSFRIDTRADNIVIMAFAYSSEGSTGDIPNRTPQLIFSKPAYSVAVRNDARSSGLITLTSPSANDTTYVVEHDSSLVLNFTVKKGYQPVVQGYGKLTGAPSATSDTAYSLAIDKAKADDTIRLSADVIRFNVDVVTPNGHVTVIQPATGRSPYKVANDSSFALSFRVDEEYIPTATVSTDPTYQLGDTAPGGYYTVTLPQVTTNVTVTIAADLSDSVTVWLAKHDSVTVTSPTLTGGAAGKVARDSSFTLTFTLADGYDVSAVRVNGVDRSGEYLAVDGEGVYTFTLPQLTASVSVAIEVGVRQYGVVLIAGEGVSVVAPAGANPHLVDHNGSLEVRVTIAAGYFAPVKLARRDGSVITASEPSGGGGEYAATISGITAADTVSITADNGVRHITVRKDARVTLVDATDTVLAARLTEPFELIFTVPDGFTPTVTLQGEGGGQLTTLPTGAGNTYSARISAVGADAILVIALAAATGIADVDLNDPVVSVTYYSLQGREVRQPELTGVYILRRQHLSGRTSVVKRLVRVD
ncbi:MAG: right-handed parallel beta-helix repeat-containing protein [Prevotellaceae bacterium]|jgi:hypothetical protein|nr:right-handed parallel beta-helix repeat-containing protein [Prevotellaceae bacterium]